MTAMPDSTMVYSNLLEGRSGCISQKITLPEMEALFGGQDNNNASFFHMESCDPGSGGARLLRKAFGLGNDAQISNEEQRFVFKLTNLLLNVTVDDRSRLA